MSVLYLGAIALSAACVLAVDLRFRLFFGRAPWRAALVVAIGVAFLLAWDAVGIMLGVFFRTDNAISTGVLLAPDLPLEEPLFLAFLTEVAMVLYTGGVRVVARRRAAAGERTSGASHPSSPARDRETAR